MNIKKVGVNEAMLEKILERQSQGQYSLIYFASHHPDVIEKLEKSIISKGNKFYIKCTAREENGEPKLIEAKPEEIVRQAFLHLLIDKYDYDKSQIAVEYPLSDKAEDLADIVVFEESSAGKGNPKIKEIFETKKLTIKEGIEQLKRYLKLGKAKVGIWSNGETIEIYRLKGNKLIPFPRILKKEENIEDVLIAKRDWEFLKNNDQLSLGLTTLKKILLNMEEIILANAGVDDFREIFKVIFAKLMDEYRAYVKYQNKEEYTLKFATSYVIEKDSKKEIKLKNEQEVFNDISELFESAKREWSGIFDVSEKIKLKKSQLYDCVSFLEYVKLFNSNLQVIDEAFEYLILKITKKKHGQYFTPRPVIDFGIEATMPKLSDYVLDPACGSAGFIVHTLSFLQKRKITATGLKPEVKEYAQNNVLMFDFSEDAVKIAKAINIIIGDGKNNVYAVNSLDIREWRSNNDLIEKLLYIYIKKKKLAEEIGNVLENKIYIPTHLENKEKILQIKDKDNTDTKTITVEKNSILNLIFHVVLKRIVKSDSFSEVMDNLIKDIKIKTPEGQEIFTSDSINEEDYQKLKSYFSKKINQHVGIDFLNYELDVFNKIYTNPPFAGTIKEKPLLNLYEFGKGRKQSERHILFIERCIRLLSHNGILFIVLPEGIFSNIGTSYIRRFLIENGEIVAITSLHRNTFRPHTSIKTSTLVFRKFTKEEREKIKEKKLNIRFTFDNMISSIEEIGEDFLGELENRQIEKDENLDVSSYYNFLYEKVSKEDINILLDFIGLFFEGEEDVENEEGQPIHSSNKVKEILNKISKLIKTKKDLKERIEKDDALKEKLDLLEDEKKELEIELRKYNCRKEENKEKCENIRERIKELKNKIKETKQNKSKKSEKNKLHRQVGGIEKKIREELLPELFSSFSELRFLSVAYSERIKNEFENFFFERKLLEDLPEPLNYEVCFGINEKPIKNNKGEYRFKRRETGVLETDENGHPIVNTDLFELTDCIKEKIIGKEKNGNNL